MGGGVREGREIDPFESLELRRDRNPERCSPRPPSQGSLKQLLSTHQKLMVSKTFSTISCLIELVHVMGGSCFSELK